MSCGNSHCIEHQLKLTACIMLCGCVRRENVGGSVLEKVLNISKNHARIVACGMVRWVHCALFGWANYVLPAVHLIGLICCAMGPACLNIAACMLNSG